MVRLFAPPTRWWLAACLWATAVSAQMVGPHSWPGRFAPLEGLPDTRAAVNSTYALQSERVLKLSGLLPRRDGAYFGTLAYAGSFTIGLPDGRFGNDLPAIDRSSFVHWHDADRVEVGLRHELDQGTVEMAMVMTTDDPRVAVRLTRLRGHDPLRGGLIGWSWADLRLPAALRVDDRVFDRPVGQMTALGAATQLAWLGDGGFAQLLVFEPAPTAIRVSDDGLVWDYAPEVGSAKVTCALLPGSPPDHETERWLAAADRTRLVFGGDEGHPWLELRADGPGDLIAPASVSGLCPEDWPTIATAAGPQRLAPGPVYRVTLPTPPGLNAGLPPWPARTPGTQARLQRQVEAVLRHQRPDGTFDFAEGRAFYEGTTLAILSLVADLLPAELDRRVRAAVEQGLAYQWSHFEPLGSRPWDTMPPEQPGFTGDGIDYPEILSTLLQATLLHSQRWASEPVVSLGKIAVQARQLGAYMDRSGIALANPGPTFWHTIAESAIGGYLAWQALAALRWNGEGSPWAAEAAARAAYAWEAWQQLFAQRAEFADQNLLVNGYERGRVQLSNDPAWTYVQSTWFTHLPCFALPVDDRFGVWRALAAQPWQEWTGRLASQQRAYDAANAIALARAGRLTEAKTGFAATLDRLYTWETFDTSPVLELAALAWLGNG